MVYEISEIIMRLLSMLSILFGLGLFIAMLSVSFWQHYRKNGGFRKYLERNGDPVDDLCNLVNISWQKVCAYAFTFPLMALGLLGAATFCQTHPSWTLGITLFLIIFSFAFLYPLLKHIYYLFFYVGMSGALAIDQYIKEEYPLEHYESKPGDRNGTTHRE